MHRSSSLSAFFQDRGLRSAAATAGLVVYSFGTYLQMQANIGLSPWNALNLGLSNHTAISYGTASIAISLAVVVLDLLLREPIGLGTILDALVVGWSMDFFLWLDCVPLQTALLPQLLLLLAGLVVMCVGAVLYMRPGLSCGPRDAMLVALGRRIPRLSIGCINILLLGAVLAASVWMGVSPGIGTAITVFGTGIVMDLVFHCMHFEPRQVEHEGLSQTWHAFLQARGAARPAAH